MTSIVITQRQFEKLKEVFETYPDIPYVQWVETYSSGIGPNVTLKFTPDVIEVNITDVDSW